MAPQGRLNHATWMTTAALGVTYAIAGFHHGFFEALQGSRPTGGLAVASVGPDQLRWEYGTDDAITLIPDFLATGIAAMAVSVAIVVWCLFFLRRRQGPEVFLALFFLLTLVGGGIGHIPFFLTAWAYATRMRRPLSGWRRVLRGRTRESLARAWLPALVLSSILFLLALEASIFGVVPGVAGPEGKLAAIWATLLASLLLASVAYVGAFARDVQAWEWADAVVP